jgi:hypothetical protein
MSVTLREHVTTDRPLRVDRARGLIFGAKLLGWKSQNGRRYDPSGVDPKLYEGKPINANHVKSGQDRSIYDRVGRIADPVKRATGIFATLEILKSHPLANVLFEAAERGMGVLGMSHTATGKEKPGSAGAVIAALESVSSCDVVADPASTSSLGESRAAGTVGTALRCARDVAGARRRLAEARRRGWPGPALVETVPARAARLGRWLSDGPDDLREARQANRRDAVRERLRRRSPRLARLFEMAEEGLLDMAGGAAASGVQSPLSAEQERREAIKRAIHRLLDDHGLTLADISDKIHALLLDPQQALDDEQKPAAESRTPWSSGRPTGYARTANLREQRERRRAAGKPPADAAKLGAWLTSR